MQHVPPFGTHLEQQLVEALIAATLLRTATSYRITQSTARDERTTTEPHNVRSHVRLFSLKDFLMACKRKWQCGITKHARSRNSVLLAELASIIDDGVGLASIPDRWRSSKIAESPYGARSITECQVCQDTITC
jgi:hypothetical protein